MRRLRIGAGLTCLLALAACKTPRPDGGQTLTAQEVRTPDGAPRNTSALGSSDVVEIRVFQETDLSGPYRISSDGTIDYPLCGKVALAGKTSSQAADALISCLGAHYLKNPQVSVMVRDYNSKKIFVLGEVQKPGTFPFEERMSIIQAITISGGFSARAAKNGTSVTRLVDGREQRIRVAVEDIGIGKEKNFLLEPGDIVFVPESFF